MLLNLWKINIFVMRGFGADLAYIIGSRISGVKNMVGNHIPKNSLKIFLFTIFLICISSISHTGEIKIKKWPNGKVYYTFIDLESGYTSFIRIVMDDIEELTKVKSEKIIRFAEVSEVDYRKHLGYRIVEVTSSVSISNTNEATIGYSDRPFCNLLNFDYDIVLHELCHVLGLNHEFTRPDRDYYIIINIDNIEEDYLYNFYVLENHLYNYELFPYDYDSIMGYDSITFVKNIFKPNMVNKKTGKRLKRSEKLTPLDISKLQEIYKRK